MSLCRIEPELSWNLSGIGALGGAGRSTRNEPLDGIVGIKGIGGARFGRPLFVAYYVDVGGATRARSWQALAALATESAGANDRCLPPSAVRPGGGALVQDLKLGGPLIGASFRGDIRGQIRNSRRIA